MDAAPLPPAAEFARIEHSEALLKAIRARITQLELSHEVLDYAAGLPLGYSGKLLANPPVKRMGHFTLFLILQTLGLDIVLVENPEALESLKNRHFHRRRPFMLRQPRITVFTPDFRRVNGSKGARARNIKLSAKRRIALARRAARARWARVRALAAAASQPAPASP